MPTLKHPVIPDLTVDVDTKQVSDWKSAGWLDPRAKGPEPTTDPSSGDDE